jgi:hypothetical protein
MESSLLAFRIKPCRQFVIALTIGVVLAAASSGANADNVDVQVAVVQSPPSGPYNNPPWACSEPQAGPSSAYVICVNPETVKTKGAHQGDPVTITWTLDDSTGWTFPAAAGGIYIKKKKKWTVNPGSPPTTKYVATNTKENGTVKYSYTVGVINGSYLLTWDPTIMN